MVIKSMRRNSTFAIDETYPNIKHNTTSNGAQTPSINDPKVVPQKHNRL